jgi:hypothetical protein
VRTSCHPRGERAAVQTAVVPPPRPERLSADRRQRAGLVLALHEGLELAEGVADGHEPVEAGALGRLQDVQIRVHGEALGRGRGRRHQDDHLAGDAQECQKHLGDHRE